MSNTNIPEMIGKYKVTDVIAKGGMGVVYKAIHPSLKRYVVIKKMTARKNATNAERFKKEAQILLDLQSPYIVHLFDYFTEGGYRYMVEELVDGLALDKIIQKQTTIPLPIAMLILQDACYALKYAHSKQIIHRDIKPGNILISKRGEVKLADFGIASEKVDDITQDGEAIGTPAYMPPEQYENSATVDNRADIYALGIMLYEMLTGTKPYPGTFSLETLRIIKSGKYIKPRQIDKSLPYEIQLLIQKMIKPNRKARFKSIDSVLRFVKSYLRHYNTHDLRVYLAKTVMTSGMYKFPTIRRKDRLQTLVALIGLGACALVAFLVLLGKAGVYHKTFLRGTFTPVVVDLEVPRPLLDNMTDLPIRAFFYYNDNNEIPEIENARSTFDIKGTKRLEDAFSFKKKVVADRLNSANCTYDIPTVYLRKGDYRVKIVVGPYVIWESFNVAKEAKTIKCNQLVNAHRDLQIKVRVVDANNSKKKITDKSKVYVYYKKNWVNINKVPKEELRSGKVWKIKVSAEGYQDEIFSLLIDWYQNVLYINSSLKPEI